MIGLALPARHHHDLTAVRLVSRRHVDLCRLAGALCRRGGTS
jgi:hypothetical protein